MHVVVNRRSTKAGQGIISQKDMAITLFTFMGFHILNPKQFGIVGSREQFEAFNHLWRVLGYLMGTKDEFNCCGENLDETLGRLKAMQEDVFVPQLQFPCPEYESYTRMAVNGMWHFDPSLHYDSMMWMMRRSLKVPGYYYFDSEASGEKRVYESLSLYTKFRILLDIIVYENLSHIFIFRWIFNIARILFSIIDKLYPFLSLKAYGKKYAYVEIMKSKT
jgi:ER-bound oxygenase mpaB/B'/Rubber oxygenase, catalytic domain